MIFSAEQVIDEMKRGGSRYPESTIRTHIVSALCVNAPRHHATTYQDLFRVDRGLYELYDPGRHGTLSRERPSVSAPRHQRDNGVVTGRVAELIGDFDRYVSVYDAGVPFSRAGQWEFHAKTIGLRRSLGSVEACIESNEFRSLLRQTLRKWGIGIRGSRNVSEDEFAQGLRDYKTDIASLGMLRLEDQELPVQEVTDKVWRLVRDLPVVESKAKIVAGTKTLHHILPDLVPPMDRAWTGKFFNWSLVDPQNNQERIFRQAFASFAEIAQKTQPSRLVRKGWRTSATKILDNAFIGYLKSHTGVR
jgi:hypothetical protein